MPTQAERLVTLTLTTPTPIIPPPLVAYKGKVIVEMDPWTEQVGSILLPDKVGGRLRPTCGTVLASGSPYLKAGDRVCVARMAGMWLQDFECGEYRPHRQVRVYGDGSLNERHRKQYDPLDAIFGVLEDETIRPIGDWVLIKRDPVQQTALGLHLPDERKYRGVFATVVAAGEGRQLDNGEFDVIPFAPHDRVMINPRAPMTDLEWLDERYPKIIEEFGGVGSDYGFIRAVNVHAVVAA